MYACPVCHRTFRYESLLQRHRERRRACDETRPHVCPNGCGRAYLQPTSLCRHLKDCPASPAPQRQQQQHTGGRQRPFRQEDTSYVSHEDMVRLLKSEDLYRSHQEVVEAVFLNPSHPENMNVYGGPYGATWMAFYDADADRWHVAGADWVADVVSKQSAGLMNEFIDEHARRFTAKEHRRFANFYRNLGVEHGIVLDTIRTLRDLAHMIERAHPAADALRALDQASFAHVPRDLAPAEFRRQFRSAAASP